jgi:hypothetical protein
MYLNASPSPPSDSSTWEREIDDVLQRFEAAMQECQEKMQETFQKTSDDISAAFQIFKEVNLELHQRQVKKISLEDSDHSDANKRTSERVDTKITEPIPEASAIVLCSHGKVECRVPVSSEESEKTITIPATPFSELRSPPENFQPSSPKQVRSQQEVTKKIKESNLFARMKAVERFRKEPKKLVQQQASLPKLYIPSAPRVVIKEDKWYVQERGRAVELTPTRKRNLQRRFGQAKRTLEALNLGLVKPEELKQTQEQLRRTVERLSVRQIIPAGRQRKQPELVRHQPSVFARRTSYICEPIPKRQQWRPKQVKSQNTAADVVPKSQLKEPKLILIEPVPVGPTVRQFIFPNNGQFCGLAITIRHHLCLDWGAILSSPTLLPSSQICGFLPYSPHLVELGGYHYPYLS